MKIRKKLIVIFLMVMILLFNNMIFISNDAYAITEEQHEGVRRMLNDYIWSLNNTSFYNINNGYFSCPADGYGGEECLGFARYMMHELFGYCDHCGESHYEHLYSGNINSINDLRVGDVIRYGASGYNHSIMIANVGVNDNKVEVFDANYNYDNKILLRVESFEEIKNHLNSASKVAGEVTQLYREPGNNLKDRYTEYDNVAPVIEWVRVCVYDMQNSMYRIEAKVTDNVGVTSVRFPTWVSGQSGAQAVWHDAICDSNDGLWKYVVQIKDHGNYKGIYHTHVYAYDAVGNESTNKNIENTLVGEAPLDLGNFTARITAKANNNIVLGSQQNSEYSDIKDIVLQNKNYSDKSQLWKFEKQSGGNYYRIKNVSTGMYMHVHAGADENGRQIFSYQYVNENAQLYFILNYNGGYRLVPALTSNMKALDLGSNTYKLGTKTVLWGIESDSHDLQTVKFEKVATAMTVNPTSISMTVGETKYFSVSFTPTDVAIKSFGVACLSPVTGAANIDSSGKITALKAGTSKFEVSSADGSNLKTIITVTVADKPQEKNGLVKESGIWRYYKNGEFQSNYTGLVKKDGAWFYIQKGVLHWGVETLVKKDGTWFYVKNSVVDWSFTGLFKKDGAWFYIQKGVLHWGVETLVKKDGTWFYVKNSIVDWNYTGLVKKDGTWFYVQKGVMRWGYNGTITWNGKKYTIKNSMVV